MQHQAQWLSSMGKLLGKGSTKGRGKQGTEKGWWHHWGIRRMGFVGKFLWGNPTSLRDSMVNRENRTQTKLVRAECNLLMCLWSEGKRRNDCVQWLQEMRYIGIMQAPTPP